MTSCRGGVAESAVLQRAIPFCPKRTSTALRSLWDNVEVTYADFPSVPHKLQETYQDNPDGVLRAEQFYYTLPDTPISDLATVRIERLPLQYNKKLERINGHWPEDVLELRKTKPLILRWSDNKTLIVLCDGCGKRLSDASNKLDLVYGVHVKFEGFRP
ncbi:hypothetical protein HDF16_006304 [Granulicella aggregans]|uniref:Uncharacterized protein n=1 Tax=Granulicella aggregans TaxID=474949 RepID=A0A7W7ZKK9_9BACT|nr:hypothetical protein [Granulicella aggregans]